MTPDPAPPHKGSTFGFAIALALAALQVVAGLWSPVTAIVPLIVFVTTAIGLRKGRAWSGYGAALFLLALGAGLIIGEARVGIGHAPWPVVTTAAGLAYLAAVVLFVVGRSLAGNRARGSKLPWLALFAATLLFTVTFKAFIIPTGAMENTLLIGDYVYVSFAGPTFTPSRGDIIALRYPVDPKQSFVKRVIAVGGDRVRLINKKLFLNGVPVDEPYVTTQTAYIDTFRDNFPSEPNARLAGGWAEEIGSHLVNGDLVVPAGKYFVLGDNRDNSLDSRYWGFIDRSAIIGQPRVIYFSANEPSESFADAQQVKTAALLTPSRIRWNRILRFL